MPRFFVTLTSMTIVSGQTLENKTDAKATAVTSTGRFQKSEFHRPLSGYVSEERTVETRPSRDTVLVSLRQVSERSGRTARILAENYSA